MLEDVPVPDTGRVAGAALLANAIFPVTPPVACGVKVTEKAETWPGLRVKGKVIPLTPKPAPVAVVPVMVTLLPPELVIVAGCVCVLPTCTLPNPRLAGDTPKAPGDTAVPVMAKPRFGFIAVDTIDRLPFKAPAAIGAKITWKDAL